MESQILSRTVDTFGIDKVVLASFQSFWRLICCGGPEVQRTSLPLQLVVRVTEDLRDRWGQDRRRTTSFSGPDRSSFLFLFKLEMSGEYRGILPRRCDAQQWRRGLHVDTFRAASA